MRRRRAARRPSRRVAGVAAAGRGGWVSSAGDGGGAGREERRRPPGGLAGSASAGPSPCTPVPPGRWTPGPGTGPCFGAGGRTAAKFKRLNLTALADTAGRGGRGRGRAWTRVTWARGGAWQASLLFWLARAQKAEHVAFSPSPLGPPPAGAAGPLRRVWGERRGTYLAPSRAVP